MSVMPYWALGLLTEVAPARARTGDAPATSARSFFTAYDEFYLLLIELLGEVFYRHDWNVFGKSVKGFWRGFVPQRQL